MNDRWRILLTFAGYILAITLAATLSVYLVLGSINCYMDLEISKHQYAELKDIKLYSSIIPEYQPAVALIQTSLLDNKITVREFYKITKLANEGFLGMQKRNLQEAKRSLLDQTAERE